MAIQENVTSTGLGSINELNSALHFINPLVIKIIIAVLILLMGFIIGKIVQKLVLKLLDLVDLDAMIAKSTGFKLSIEKILSSIASYIVYLIAIVMALNTLEITTPVIKTVVIVLVIVLLLILFFGLGDLFANFIAGIVVRSRKNLKKGEYIRIKDKDVEGTIVDINLLNIHLETDKDEFVFVPNMSVFKSQITKIKHHAKKGKNKR